MKNKPIIGCLALRGCVVRRRPHVDDPAIVLEASKELEGVAMRGTEISEIEEPMKMANRGW